MVCYNTGRSRRELWDGKCVLTSAGNKRGVVLHSCIVSHIVAITNGLVLLTSVFLGKRNLEEYSRLPIALFGEGEEVHFG